MKPSSELLQKYNVAGPRYTSYPTVPYWDTHPTVEQWLASIARGLDQSEQDGTGAAMYVHVPFCESLCTYCGCNTRIKRNRAVGNPYVDSVLAEWRLYRSRLNRARAVPLAELHLGGGTPTFLSPAELSRLISGVLEGTEVLREAEFSIEADPRVTSAAHLETLAGLGFKRLSLGIQDFDPKVQEVVHRVQSEDQVRTVTDKARSLGFSSINYDLIYGLPLQTSESIEQTLEAVTRLKPDRIAFYAYAHVPWIKASHRRFTEADLPSGDAKRALYELGRERLAQAGYFEIGMDHFALKSDSLWKAVDSGSLHRNFMGYTARRVAPLIGLGVSSIGDSWDVYAQNEKSVEVYQRRVQQGEIPLHRGHVLSDEDRTLRRHVLNLMTTLSTSWDEKELQTPYLESVSERLSELCRDGLVKVSSQGCEVTESGRAFLRNVCMAFDARLARKAPTTALFSRTV